MSKRDYYDLLGIARTASMEDIKKSYRKLAMKYHPDKNPDDKVAEDKFKAISEAYDVLRDPKRRQMYDQFGHAGIHAQAGASSGPESPFGGGFYGGFSGAAGAGAPGSGPESFQDFFGDFFNDFFTGAAGPRPKGQEFRQRTQKGADLRYTVTIHLEEAAKGCEKRISFVRQKKGRDETANLSITIPSGVKESQRLKLRGEGDVPVNGKPGDLYVIVNFHQHPIFKRRDNDVLMELPISFIDAILGAQAQIPTLGGKASLTLPPGTYAGQIFRLKNKGFPEVGGYGHGDQLVKIVIDVPRQMSEEEKESVKKLSHIAKRSPLISEFEQKLQSLLKQRSSS